jgi:hypothetical protein
LILSYTLDLVTRSNDIHRLIWLSNRILDDFEVSIFLTELSSRHSVLTKQKIFKDKARIRSNSGKLTNWLTAGTSDQPVHINEDAKTDPIVIRDEDDDDAINLADIPEAGNASRASRRPAQGTHRTEASGLDITSEGSDSDSSALFVAGDSNKPRSIDAGTEDEAQEDKKKLGLNTSYDGFRIYGRILCLVVNRRGRTLGGAGASASSQQMMEHWVSTQAASDQIDDEEDIG